MDERLGTNSPLLEQAFQALTHSNSGGIPERSLLQASTIDPLSAQHLIFTASLLEQSWQALDEVAANLLQLLSVFALAPIPWSIAEVVTHPLGWSEAEVDAARMRLYEHGLLQITDRGYYELNVSAREFVQSQLKQSTQADCFEKAVANGMALVAQQLIQAAGKEDAEDTQATIPHLEAVVRGLSDRIEDDLLHWCFIALGRFYVDRGIYEQAEYWYEQCLSVVQARLGPQHPSVVVSLNNLAALYESMERFDAAEGLHTEALSLSTALWGSDDLTVATSLNNLASLYKRRGEFSKAEPLYEQALQIRRQRLGNKHPSVATSWNNLASLYYAQADYKQAEPLYLKALHLRRCLLGTHHPSVATSLNNLAGVYYAQGKYVKAVTTGQQAVQLSERILGVDHPETIAMRQNLRTIQLSLDASRSSLLFGVKTALGSLARVFG